MIKSAVICSEETTTINNNFRDEVIAVKTEVYELAVKLEQDGALDSFMMSEVS